MGKSKPLSSRIVPFELFSEITFFFCFVLRRVFWREVLKKKQILCLCVFEVTRTPLHSFLCLLFFLPSLRQVVIEDLLCARHCAGCWGHSNEPNQQIPALVELIFRGDGQ